MTAGQYRIGHLRFSLGGDDPVLPAVAAELASLACSDSSPCDLDIRFTRDLPPLIEPIRIDELRATRDTFEASHNRLRYQLSRNDAHAQLSVRSELDTWKHRLVPDTAARWRDRSFMTPKENAAKDFLYNVFDYVTQLCGLDHGQSYFHASSVSQRGRGVAFAAWGGVGKTSTVLHLLQNQEWGLLSDDLALIDSSGVLHPTPKRIQIYGYNLAGRPDLRRRVLDGRSLTDRAAMELRGRVFGSHGVRRRVSAAQLFGLESLGRPSQLAYIALLRRAEVDALAVSDLTTGQLAHHAAVTLIRELRPLVEIATALHSSVSTSAVPSPEQFVGMAAEVLRTGFDRASTELITIPMDATPEDLGEFLERRIETNLA